MKGKRRLDLNLASRPVRNRRLYRLTRNALIVLLAAIVGLAGVIIVSDSRRASGLSGSLAELKLHEGRLQTELVRLSEETRKADKADRAAVDAVNGIIYRKSFSWASFLSLLEKALPDSSFITSLAPSSADGRTVALRLQLVSGGLEDVLSFMKNLTAQKFNGIRVESQSMTSGGQIVSELSMTYERTI